MENDKSRGCREVMGNSGGDLRQVGWGGNILKEVAPEELERAKLYWMAHIDGALLSHQGWLGGSFISLEDTLEALEEEEFEEEEEF